VLPALLDAFTFFFIIGAASLPTAIASYSLVGEKVEGCLEPLLATPASESDILMGKSIAAFVPPVAAIYAGAIVFMALCDRLTYDTLGRLYFPNWTSAVILGVVTPLAAIMSIEFSILISARATDVRAAQQFGALAVLPFAGIYVAAEINVLTLNIPMLGIISAVIACIDVGLFFASRATFQREQILTRWA
jgi:ABC-2 type transport system permease protein